MAEDPQTNNEEQTNKVKPDGDETGKNIPSSDKPVSLYDKTEAIVTRQEEANKKTEELLERQEKLHANQRLAGTTGGNVLAPVVSEDEKKTKQASEFFKGSALGDAIDKANE